MLNNFLFRAEPLKKKKKLDPAIIRAREERKKKRIEKQIRKLEKGAKQLKPIEECEVSLSLLDEKKHAFLVSLKSVQLQNTFVGKDSEICQRHRQKV